METPRTDDSGHGTLTTAYALRTPRGGAFRHYWRNLKESVLSLFDGLSITLSHMMRAPVTVQYPEVNVKAQLPERYRGFLNVDMDVCISCRNCEKACPIDCIYIEDVKLDRKSIVGNNGKATKKLLFPTVFNIDLSKCMWCGLCVEPCPTGAIYFTKEFERSTSNIRDLYFEFVSPQERAASNEKAAKLAAQEAKKKAEAQAKAKEQAAQGKPGAAGTPGGTPQP